MNVWISVYFRKVTSFYSIKFYFEKNKSYTFEALYQVVLIMYDAQLYLETTRPIHLRKQI